MSTSLSPIEGMSLLERAVSGDQYAWNRFIEEHTHLVTLWARRYREVLGPDGIEETVNFAWAKFAQAMTVSQFHKFQGMAQVMGYLRTITTNLCLDQVRSLLSHGSSLSLEEQYELCGEFSDETKQNVADLVEEQDSYSDTARTILATLKNEQEQIVFKMQFLLHLKPKEVLAQHVELFHGNIKEVYRAKINMTQRLRRNTELRMVLGLKPLPPRKQTKAKTRKTEQVALLRAA